MGQNMRGMFSRALPAVTAYLFTAAILIGTILLLERHLPPAALQSFLAYVFIATLAAGLEPGTAKAALVAASDHRQVKASTALIVASVLKGLLVSPVLVAVWVLSGASGQDPSVLLMVPVLAWLGFVASDVRALIDAQGRHAAAIWLKQGSLSLAIIVAAWMVAKDHSLLVAIAAACLARAAWTAGFIWWTAGGKWTTGRVSDHLMSRRWTHLLLTSALGAMAGSVDRVVAFRLLEETTSNAYILLYEVLTKFWLLPYLLVPVTFVKSLQSNQDLAFRKFAYALILIAGVPFLFGAMALPFVPVVTVTSAGFEVWGVSLFAAAIIIASFNQLLASELQASDRAGAATASATAGLFVAVVAFPVLVLWLGLNGLFVAWLLKSLAETAVIITAIRQGVRP